MDDEAVNDDAIEAKNALISWAGGLLDWQRDALRRLSKTEELDEQNKEDLLNQVKKAAGFTVQAVPGKLFSGSDIGANPNNMKIALKEITEIENINALSSNTKLKFDSHGLTIVYGPNGSGKTGFIRILKKACGKNSISKESLKILSDIYSDSEDLPKKAKILIDLNGQEKIICFDDNFDVEDFSPVSIFDVNSTSLYISEGGKIDILPFGLDLPFKLRAVCDYIREKLKEEQEKLGVNLSKDEYRIADTSTLIGEDSAFYNGLKFNTSDNDIEKVCFFSEKMERELRKAEGMIRQNTGKIEPIKRLKSWCERVNGSIEKYEKYLSPESIEQLLHLKKGYDEAKEKTESHFMEETKNYPIKNVGTDNWKKLWEAAKIYSEMEAYPGKDFPVLDEEESRCVLCHQELDIDAKKRFDVFSKLIANQFAGEEVTARRKYESFFEKFQNNKIFKNESEKAFLEQLSEYDDELSASLKNWVKSAENILDIITNNKDKLEEKNLGTLSAPPRQTLAAFIEMLDETIKSISSNEILKKNNEEIMRLESKKALYNNLEKIKNRRDLLSEIEKFEDAIKQAGTHSITRKAKELATTYITGKIYEQFEHERKKLNISNLRINIENANNRDGAKFTTSPQSTYMRPRTSDILSDGEQKILALCAFLTESHIANPGSSIILDDPISSLDRERSRDVAKRLLEKSRHRQVIIFTHDIVFLNHLAKAAEALNLNPSFVKIFKDDERTGIADSSIDAIPINARTVNNSLNDIKRDFKEAKNIYNENRNDSENKIRHLYARLRDVYERSVEEVIFDNIINRFEDDIDTPRLKRIDFSDELAKKFFDGMSLTSRCSHNNSSGIDTTEFINPKSFQKAIDDFEEFLRCVKKAHTECENRRKRKYNID